jgi:addiction module RelB/DinJ family antitoxin
MKSMTLRISDELHHESNAVLEQIGLDMPTAFRIFLTQVATTRSIPFELKAPQAVWEEVPVDSETQAKMDDIAKLWAERSPARR